MRRTYILHELLVNGLNYRFHRLTGSPCAPQAVSLEVTHQCMSRCMMCSIWKIQSSVPDVPLHKWIQFLSSPFFSDIREIDIAGGEPFLRKDLEELVSAVVDLKSHSLKKLRGIAITTYNYLTKRILQMTGQMASILREIDMDLVFALGMDGVGEMHNRIQRVRRM